MASLSLKNICKVYPNGFEAVKDFNLEIADKEFIIFVGPSGCGKSTTLRMIAGLEDISSGELKIGDRVVNDVEPKDRDIAMVFQNYALYPHMTVYDNMALSRINDAGHELDAQIRRTAEALELTEVLFSLPAELSGGMRHRVALGRTFLSNANLMILDEPFRGLDEELKERIVQRLWKETTKGKTVILISHNSGDCEKLSEKVVLI